MIAVIDAGVVMNSSLLPNIKEDLVIPKSVKEEIRSQQASHLYEILQEKSQLSVVDPLPKFVEKIQDVATNIGQNNLSDQDIDVLATALMLAEQGQVVIYSDDYGLRNVAHELDIKSRGITTKGGNQRRQYKYRCNACGEIYLQIVPDCDICGHEKFKRLRRK